MSDTYRPAGSEPGDASPADDSPPDTTRMDTTRMDTTPLPVDRAAAVSSTPAAAAAAADDATRTRRARMRTVVLGFVLAVVAITALVGQAADVSVDAGSVAVVLLIGAGLLLLVGAVRSR
jgi:hypothetical protein